MSVNSKPPYAPGERDAIERCCYYRELFLRSLATNWELRTAGVCPEESEVVLAPQLRGHQEPVAPLHLRHFDLGLAQDGRLLVLAEDENSTQ